MYNLTSYKTVIESIHEIEREEIAYQRGLLNYTSLLVVVSLGILIIYAIVKGSTGIFVSSGLVGTALIPLFNYLYNSYLQDQFDQTRFEIIESVMAAYENGFPDEQLGKEKIKEIIYDLLKLKYNGGS